VADNSNIVSDLILLLHTLTEHNYTSECADVRLMICVVRLSYVHLVQLVRRSVVSAVMVSLSDTHRSAWCTDTLLILHIALLNKLSTSG
jgi:hypothetical protein